MSSDSKVNQIFQELAGKERADRLDPSRYLADVNDRITSALAGISDDEAITLKRDEMGFHLVDWQSDAAFNVALALFPERFTDEKIREEVERFLIHVPYHVIEAA